MLKPPNEYYRVENCFLNDMEWFATKVHW